MRNLLVVLHINKTVQYLPSVAAAAMQPTTTRNPAAGNKRGKPAN